MEPDLNLLYNVIDKLRVYLIRLEVQVQLFAIVAVLGIAFLISMILWRLLWANLQKLIQNKAPQRSGRLFSFVVSFLQAITFPVMSLIILDIARDIFLTNGWLDGLLVKFTWMLWVLIFFQINIVILYALADKTVVKRYHYRLFIPLLVMTLFLLLLNNLVNLGQLSGVVLTTVFNNPITIGAIFVATIGLYFWADILQSFDDLLHNLFSTYTHLDPGGTKAVLTLARYVLVISGIVFALDMLQLSATTVAAISGGLAVGIGFGLREILSNFISGFYLLFERSLHPGDVIEVDGELSVVDNLSIRSTTVRTLNNVELVIPNQIFFTSSFKTFTGTERTVRVPILLNTNCEIDPANVIALLQATALNHPHVLTEPIPSVFLLEYGNNVASFQLNIWLENPLLIPTVKSELKVQLWQALADHGIALPFPEMELHFPSKVPIDLLNSNRIAKLAIETNGKTV